MLKLVTVGAATVLVTVSVTVMKGSSGGGRVQVVPRQMVLGVKVMP